MNKNIKISLFVVSFIFISCQPQLIYNIKNENNNSSEYTIATRLNNTNISFFANYRWTGDDTVTTAIHVHLENGSRNEIQIIREEMLVVSRTFNYKIKNTNDIKIKPKTNRSFWLEYEAVFNPAILPAPAQMPEDEELLLMPRGLKVNRKLLSIEDISFVPRENKSTGN